MTLLYIDTIAKALDRIAALEARLAEAETHRDKNRETAVALQLRVSELEEEYRESASKQGHRLIELEAALKEMLDNALADGWNREDAHIYKFDAVQEAKAALGGSPLEARVRYCECGLPLDGHTHGTRPSQSETGVAK